MVVYFIDVHSRYRFRELWDAENASKTGEVALEHLELFGLDNQVLEVAVTDCLPTQIRKRRWEIFGYAHSRVWGC
jgi:hypothetical protein